MKSQDIQREKAIISNFLELLKPKDHLLKSAFINRLTILSDLLEPRYEVLYEREYELLKAPTTTVTIIRSTVLDITPLYPLNKQITFEDLAELPEKEILSSWFSKMDNRTIEEFMRESISEYYYTTLERTPITSIKSIYDTIKQP